MTALDTTVPRADIGTPALPPDRIGLAGTDGPQHVLAVDIGAHGAAALLDEAGARRAVRPGLRPRSRRGGPDRVGRHHAQEGRAMTIETDGCSKASAKEAP